MSDGAPVTLRLTTVEGTVRDVPLKEEMLVLGSGPAAGLRVHDPAVSSLHLLLKRHRDTVLAIDLASEAGTQVADTPLQAPRALRHGDVIRLGRKTVPYGPDGIGFWAEGIWVNDNNQANTQGQGATFLKKAWPSRFNGSTVR